MGERDIQGNGSLQVGWKNRIQSRAAVKGAIQGTRIQLCRYPHQASSRNRWTHGRIIENKRIHLEAVKGAAGVVFHPATFKNVNHVSVLPCAYAHTQVHVIILYRMQYWLQLPQALFLDYVIFKSRGTCRFHKLRMRSHEEAWFSIIRWWVQRYTLSELRTPHYTY